MFDTAYTPRLSVAAYLRNPSSEQVGETKVTMNIGKGIKAPSVYQGDNSLYALVAGTPAGAGVNPIGPERSRGFDFGLEQAFAGGRLRARVGYFNNTFEDLLEFLSRTQLVAAGVPPAVAAGDGVRRLHQLQLLRRAGRRVVGGRRARRGLAGERLVYLSHAEVTEAFGRGAVFNPAFPGVPIGDVLTAGRRPSVPASCQLGHVVRRLCDRSVRRGAVGVFCRQRATTAHS